MGVEKVCQNDGKGFDLGDVCTLIAFPVKSRKAMPLSNNELRLR